MTTSPETMKRSDVAGYASSIIGRSFGEPSAAHEWDAVMTDDAVCAKWCEKYEAAAHQQ